jgi:transcription elongation factor Elf1
MIIPPVCPNCGSENVAIHEPEDPTKSYHLTCGDCGFDSDVDPVPPTDQQAEPLLVDDELI